MEQDMLAEARAEADAELAGGAGPAIVVTASQNWHPGIVGLLASRLKEHARRPAFAIAFNPNGVGTGSGRSVTGFDLGRLVREAAAQGADRQGRRPCHGGRHHRRARQARRAARLLRGARRGGGVPAAGRGECCDIDAALAAEGATLALLEALEKAGPFGAGHVAPVFVLPRHRLEDARLGRRQPHPRRSAVRRRRAHPGDRLPRGGHGARRFPVQAIAARRCTSPARCRATTGTATARWSSASSTRRWLSFRPERSAGAAGRRSAPSSSRSRCGSPRRRDGTRSGRYGRASAAATGRAGRRQAARAKCGPG